MLLQITTARIITNYDNGLLPFTTGITTHDNCYYNSRQVLQFATLLQFTKVQATTLEDCRQIDIQRTEKFSLNGNVKNLHMYPMCDIIIEGFARLKFQII